jgi:large subunit ribosomal protein L21
MIAIIELGGKQYTVENGTTLIVDHQHVDAGKSFDTPALLVATPDAKTVHVGTPHVEGSKVTLKVEEHMKGEKVRVFKMKAKKHYSRTRGFRPMQTRVTVTSIA